MTGPDGGASRQLAGFVAEAGGPVNALAAPMGPDAAELADLGVARISYATFLYRAAMDRFGEAVAELLGKPGRRKT